MGEVALRIEQMIRRLAAKTINEHLEEHFDELLFNEMMNAASSFVKSTPFREMVRADINGLLTSGITETLLRESIRVEAESFVKEALHAVIAEILNSDKVRKEIQDVVLVTILECMASDEVQSRLEVESRNSVEACLRAVTGQLFQGFTNRSP